MLGMNGITETSGMTKNCGMTGMHGTMQKVKSEEIQTKPVDLLKPLTDGIRGRKIDITL